MRWAACWATIFFWRRRLGYCRLTEAVDSLTETVMLGQMFSGCVRTTALVALLEACEPATAKLHYWSVYPTNAVSESLLVISCDEKASCGGSTLLRENALAGDSRGGSELL